jgi:RNA polymerase sigma-70 factor (ECF subfamily)
LNHPRHLDDALVDGIRARSESAFATVYRLVASDLLTFAHGMLHDKGAAEDAVQQAFLELARAAETIEGNGRSLRAWLYRSVRFSCLDEIRRRRRRPERPTDELPDRGVDDPHVEKDPLLRAALLRLSERHRAILVLRHVLGFSIDEIASILGSNRTAVYAAGARAARRLRSELVGVESRASAASQLRMGYRRNGDRS